MSKTAVLLLALIFCSGCAARLASSDQRYRLMKIGDVDFLLPPDFSPKMAESTTVQVSLGSLGKTQQARTATDCSVRNRWFFLERRGADGDWVAQLPAPSAWEGEDDDLVVHGRERWNHFLEQIYGLEVKGCITPEGYKTATYWVRESMPTPVVFASFFNGPFDEYSFVRLRPGMRVVIERTIFRTPNTNALADYVGEIKVFYDVVRQKGRGIGLKLRSVQRSAGLSAGSYEVASDTQLARAFHKEGDLRLFLLTLYVPPGLKRTALLAGARNPTDMVRVSQMIKKTPEIPCSELATRGIACVSFEGAVSASAELNIRINGIEEYCAIHSNLASVLASLSPQNQIPGWNTLRIRRLFRGKLYDLEFRPDAPEVSKLVLFAGDEISWANKSASR